MSWLPNNGAPIIGQGLTGTEGTLGLETMRAFGTTIVAGVTPGKGGTTHHGVPIFDTVAAARAYAPEARTCVQFVPAPRVLAASLEAIEAGVSLLVIGAERVPVRDAATIFMHATTHGTQVLGPSSIGMIGPHAQIKLGFIGGATPQRAFVPGDVAVISKSGGMTSEIGIHLKHSGLGVSWAIGLGGERIMGTTFSDVAIALETDPHTKSIVIYGELGGVAEERLADAVERGDVTKPVIAFISGQFASRLPAYIPFGHAGAFIEEGGSGSTQSKKERLRRAGVTVVDDFDAIAPTIHALYEKIYPHP
jgi:succinyl-CoA synthetase alpha subunit